MTAGFREPDAQLALPQWSPAAEAGVTCEEQVAAMQVFKPQWSPAAEAGVTVQQQTAVHITLPPQWSPAAEAGVTMICGLVRGRAQAAMEPGR